MKRKVALCLVFTATFLIPIGFGVRRYLIHQRQFNVILITLDTTRADHLGCYGHSRAQTPILDSLAQSGVVFERAYASAPLTLPSHASMLTGLYPPEHGLITNGRGSLDGSIPSLAESLKADGYETAAFVASYVLDSKFGLDRGFDVYDDNLENAQPVEHALHRERNAAVVTQSALDWLSGERSGPFFCWVHYYDPHEPYLPHKDVVGDEFTDQPYDAEIAYVDSQIQRLLQHLKQKNLLQRTLIVVAGDHGEGLGDHLEKTHGSTLYNSIQHVPVIFSLPGEFIAGHRVGEAVSLVDLLPTVLECVGVDAPSNISGQSAMPALHGKQIKSRDCYASNDDPFIQYGWSPLRSLTTSEWKYIRTTKVELYNLRTDPEELNNLAGMQDDRVHKMEQQLARMEDRMVLRTRNPVQLSARERRTLQSLGYLGGTNRPSSPDSSQSLQDVKDMLPYDVKVHEALEIQQQGDVNKAIEMLQQIAEVAPAHLPARLFLGQALLQRGDTNRAVQVYQDVIKLVPESAEAQSQLASALVAQGHLDQAIFHFRRSLQVDPQHAVVHYNLARALTYAGQHLDAQQHLEEAIRLDPQFVDAHVALGNLLASLGRFADAVALLQTAVEKDATSFQAHSNLGVLLARQGFAKKAEFHLSRAVTLNSQDVQAQYNLGAFLMSEKRYRDAVPSLSATLRLDPEHPHAKAQLERVRMALENRENK